MTPRDDLRALAEKHQAMLMQVRRLLCDDMPDTERVRLCIEELASDFDELRDLAAAQETPRLDAELELLTGPCGEATVDLDKADAFRRGAYFGILWGAARYPTPPSKLMMDCMADEQADLLAHETPAARPAEGLHDFVPDSTKQFCAVCGGSVWGHRFQQPGGPTR